MQPKEMKFVKLIMKGLGVENMALERFSIGYREHQTEWYIASIAEFLQIMAVSNPNNRDDSKRLDEVFLEYFEENKPKNYFKYLEKNDDH